MTNSEPFSSRIINGSWSPVADGQRNISSSESITSALDGVRTIETLSLAFADGRKRAWLHDQRVVEAETQTETGWDLELLWTARQRESFERL